MRNTMVIVLLSCAAIAAVTPVAVLALPHVDYVRSQIPSRYSGGVEQFCRRGCPDHNWMPVVSELGTWMPIAPNYPVNYQYIPSYVQRCYSGGMIPSTVPG